MSGAGGVLALVLLETTAGWLGAAAWTQSWGVVRRGHFRILGWVGVALALLAWFAADGALDGLPEASAPRLAAVALGAAALLYLVAQYLRSDIVGVFAGAAGACVGVGALVAAGATLAGWETWSAGVTLIAGAVLMGTVGNGMMLGHWYLNQPGLKPWALARLTQLALGAVAASVLAGAVASTRLAQASTEGAVLGLPGFGERFGAIFFWIWVVLIGFTALVVWAVRRCVEIRSIQSATGLYYVALLGAGVSEFLVRYLMVNA